MAKWDSFFATKTLSNKNIQSNKIIHQTKIQIQIFFYDQIFYEMAKRYFKSVKSVQKANWSRENTTIFVQSTNQTFGTNIIPTTPTQGIRTVGNFTITLTGGTDTSNPIYWAHTVAAHQ